MEENIFILDILGGGKKNPKKILGAPVCTS